MNFLIWLIKMIKLIRNELIKVKKIKLFFSQLLFLITIYIMKRYSNNNIFDLVYNLIPFLGIFTAILFSGTIVSEIDNGSFRYYLTKPFKRYKIYLSKVIVILIYITFSLLLITSFTCLISSKIDINFILKYYLYSLPVYFIGIFTLYLSTIIKSHSFVVGLSIFTISFSLILSQLLFGINFNIIEYTFLPYLDYSIFNDEMSLIAMNHELGINLSLNKAIIIDLLSIIILYLIGNYKFNKKDIRG